MRAGPFAFAVCLALAACGEGAVTNPLLEGFDDDPRPVLGAWMARTDTPPGRFDALVERDPGSLSGFFEFELWGRWWIVHFRDATWDGENIRFTAPTDFGQQEADSLVYWEARFVPARPAPNPTTSRILLSASFGPGRNCCILSMSYQRPEEIVGAGTSSR
ncbi:MAG TPA: hypothetical protein VFH82_09710 [Gemmatimonadota bacterium]|jgi:hypothetical protein|nr:hypothetical protein [Gemmatimonadota bacterium]